MLTAFGDWGLGGGCRWYFCSRIDMFLYLDRSQEAVSARLKKRVQMLDPREFHLTLKQCPSAVRIAPACLTFPSCPLSHVSELRQYL